MANFTGTLPVFLPNLGYGARFEGLVAIAPPTVKQNAGRVALIGIKNGAMQSQEIWDGTGLSPFSSILNQNNCRIGFIPGILEELKRNLSLLDFDLIVADRLIDLYGAIEVGSLFGASKPSVVPPVTPAADTTPPTIRLL
jgi:hypothetical protein